MKKTPLYEIHKRNEARFLPFAGYEMPIHYTEGILAEHLWTREHCGIFDVSHMGQFRIRGENATQILEKITPAAIRNIQKYACRYTVMTTESGGIIDDLILLRENEASFLAIVNAGCAEKDAQWIKMNLSDSPSTEFEVLENRALIALQGPKAADVLKKTLTIDTDDLPYMHWKQLGDLWVARMGYTGEDGFEISLPAAVSSSFWDKLAEHPDTKTIGLGARDTLRLEMGYPLYGHDITEETSPIEAGLQWVIGKDRTGYFGEERIRTEIDKSPPSRKRIGICLLEAGLAREGAEIFLTDGKTQIGALTSGGFSPSLKTGIGQGYIDTPYANHKTPIFVQVRGRNIGATICDFPFLPPRTRSSKNDAQK